jgi:hypothetical protein
MDHVIAKRYFDRDFAPWKGVCTLICPLRHHGFAVIQGSMFGHDDLIAHIEAHILDVEPIVSRTLELPFSLTLDQLHAVLQAAFGWTDNHLHRFEIGGLDYGPIDPEHDDGSRRTFASSEVRLHDFALRYGRPVQFLYEYDFGDSWVHVLTLNTAQRDPSGRYPRCINGSRSGPPEDSGGAPGYAAFLQAWRDPGHSEYKEMRRWAGRRFDPEQFDLEAVNKAIRAAVRRYNGTSAVGD